MKRYLIFLSLLLILFLPNPVDAQSCLTSSEDFAVEVVVSDYDFNKLRKISERRSSGFVKAAEYDLSILAIMKETSNPSGLSIKLQVPTKIKEIEDPRIKITSTSSTGKMRDINIDSFGEWDISCSEDKCNFDKTDLKVDVKKIGDRQEVTLRINKKLEACSDSCSGICFDNLVESQCIDYKTKREFNNLLRYFTITRDFEDLFSSYRIEGSEFILLRDLEPQTNPYINWQEAIRQELVFLASRKIIDLTRSDIESIVSFSQKGQAGQNYRIVYEELSDEWKPYHQTTNAILTTSRDCTEYLSFSEEKNNFSPKSTFYLVPFITIMAGILILIVLVIIGRTITRKDS